MLFWPGLMRRECTEVKLRGGIPRQNLSINHNKESVGIEIKSLFRFSVLFSLEIDFWRCFCVVPSCSVCSVLNLMQNLVENECIGIENGVSLII